MLYHTQQAAHFLQHSTALSLTRSLSHKIQLIYYIYISIDLLYIYIYIILWIYKYINDMYLYIQYVVPRQVAHFLQQGPFDGSVPGEANVPARRCFIIIIDNKNNYIVIVHTHARQGQRLWLFGNYYLSITIYIYILIIVHTHARRGHVPAICA